jgi:hypothetical protein
MKKLLFFLSLTLIFPCLSSFGGGRGTMLGSTGPSNTQISSAKAEAKTKGKNFYSENLADCENFCCENYPNYTLKNSCTSECQEADDAAKTQG